MMRFVCGRLLFESAALPPSSASNSALGGVAADAVTDGLLEDELEHGFS
jgi:hypothetical protein